MRWYLAHPKHIRRANLEGTAKPSLTWQVVESYGTFQSRLEAMRTYMVGIEPHAAGMSDEWIAKNFSKQSRLGYIKAIKEKEMI